MRLDYDVNESSYDVVRKYQENIVCEILIIFLMRRHRSLPYAQHAAQIYSADYSLFCSPTSYSIVEKYINNKKDN